MFSFVKFVLSFSIFIAKCQPQRHQVAGCFSIKPDSVSSPVVKNNRILSRRAPQSEERIIIKLPYSNKWYLWCCWCKWLCLPYPSRYGRWVLQVTEARLFFFVLKMPRKLGWCHKHWYLTFPAVSVLDHLLLLQARHCSIGVSLWGAFCSMWNLHFPTCVDHSDYIQLSKTAATTLWPWLPWQ